MRNAHRGLWAILVLVFGAVALAAPAAAASKKVNINTASQAELEALPGVGAATASKIIAGRPYSSVDDLARAGVPASTIAKLKPVATAGRSHGGSEAKAETPKTKPGAKETKAASKEAPKSSRAESAPSSSKKEASGKKESPAASTMTVAKSGGRADLNRASQEELEALPGVGPATAQKIIAGRPYTSVDDLARAGVSKSTIEKISPLVMVRGGGSADTSKAPAQKAASEGAAAPAVPAAKTARRAPAAAPTTEEQEEGPARTPPSKGLVWVNTATKVYHYEGDRWYGKTKQGKFVTEAEALKEGDHVSKQALPKN